MQVVLKEKIDDKSIKKWDIKEVMKFGRKNVEKSGYIEDVVEECKADFFYFVKTVLNPVSPPDKYGIRPFDYAEAEHFHQMYRLLTADSLFTLRDWGKYRLATKNTKHNKKVCLLPRIHGKTTMGTVAFNVWMLFKNPNLRILINSSKWENAREMLGMIKRLYVNIRECKGTNEIIPFLVMGDWVGDLWNEDKIMVKPRRSVDKTPSISTAGIFSEITSQHFDIVDGDDMVGEENTGTMDQIEKTKQRISALTEVGDYSHYGQTLYMFFGTTWHYADWYNDVLEEMKDYYDILRLKCWDNDKDKNPLFPEKYTTEILEEIRAEKMIKNPLSWNAQWLNDPVPQDQAIFQFYDSEGKEMMQYYTELPKDLTIVICVDTAWSENKWSDYTAIVPVGIDNRNRRFVLPYWNFREDNPFIFAKKLTQIALQYKNKGLIAVGIEGKALYNTLYPHLSQIGVLNWMPLVELKPKGRSKDARILGLTPMLATKHFYMQRNMADLKDQMMKFPRGERRDLLDALAYHLDIFPADFSLKETQPLDRPLTLGEKLSRATRQDEERNRRY